jgi:hypothetical protein
MNPSSDAEALHSQVIFLKMREKSTEELTSIWKENNQKAWSKEEFDAIQKVLLERLGKLPEQTIKLETKAVSTKKKGVDSEPERISFQDRNPYNQVIAAFVIFAFICLCFGAMLTTMVGENTKLFWRFAENSKVSDIEKIEIQRINQNSNGIGKIISLTDENSIGEFIAALKTIEEYQPNHPRPENEIRVKIWRTKNRTIEFECYTMEGEGTTIFVGYLWAKPGVYSFGNGNAKFSTPDFYDWLTKNGMEIQQ